LIVFISGVEIFQLFVWGNLFRINKSGQRAKAAGRNQGCF